MTRIIVPKKVKKKFGGNWGKPNKTEKKGKIPKSYFDTREKEERKPICQ